MMMMMMIIIVIIIIIIIAFIIIINKLLSIWKFLIFRWDRVYCFHTATTAGKLLGKHFKLILTRI